MRIERVSKAGAGRRFIAHAKHEPRVGDEQQYQATIHDGQVVELHRITSSYGCGGSDTRYSSVSLTSIKGRELAALIIADWNTILITFSEAA